MAEYHFTIQGRLMGLNEMTHKNRFIYGKQKKAETQRCAWSLVGSGVPKIKKPIAIEITWIEPNSKRDIDNVAAGCKFILDGLCSAQKLANDGRKYVRGIIHRFPPPEPQNPRIEVTIREC